MQVSLTKSFYIDFVSKIDKQRYEGRFTTKKLTIGDMIRLGAMKARLSEGFSYNPVTGKGLPFFQENLTEMVSHLAVALIERPDWFKDPLSLHDWKLVEAVWQEVFSFEESFRRDDSDRDGQGDKGADSESGEAASPTEVVSPLEGTGGPYGSTSAMVDREVPVITKVG